MAVCVLVVRLSLEHAGVSTVPRLAICVTTGVAVYVALVSWREPALLAELRGLRRRSA